MRLVIILNVYYHADLIRGRYNSGQGASLFVTPTVLARAIHLEPMHIMFDGDNI
jgi:hypothetical protein